MGKRKRVSQAGEKSEATKDKISGVSAKDGSVNGFKMASAKQTKRPIAYERREGQAQDRTSPGSQKLPYLEGDMVQRDSRSSGQRSIMIQIITGSYEKVLHGFSACIPLLALQNDAGSLSYREAAKTKTQNTGLEASEPPLAKDDSDHTMRKGSIGVPGPELKIAYEDTFMLAAHTSAIKSLALSPRVRGKDRIYLASGGSDQMIQLYSLSTNHEPVRHSVDAVQASKLLSSVVNADSADSEADEQTLTLRSHDTGRKQQPRNRELGSLQHHAGSVNSLCFATKSKLLSGADDNTIAVARTRDWTILSSIKAPMPSAHGRPSGDTSATGHGPSGINDFAIHPSQKLMISVGKGERCMRLWNLVTAKKAAVLSFDRHLLQWIGEDSHHTSRQSQQGQYAPVHTRIGEGQKVRWSPMGEQFVIGFERTCVVYGTDSKPQFYVSPHPRTKIHQIRFLTILDAANRSTLEFLTLSTDDGRILFYSAAPTTIRPTPVDPALPTKPPPMHDCPSLREPIAVLGGHSRSISNRIKDYDILSIPQQQCHILITGNSDGTVRLWVISNETFSKALKTFESTTSAPAETSMLDRSGPPSSTNETEPPASRAEVQTSSSYQPAPVGILLGKVYETGHRITCLTAFVMGNGVSDEQD